MPCKSAAALIFWSGFEGRVDMAEQVGALGYFGDARRAAVGTALIERVTASGSLVIRKLGTTRAGELAIHHRFLSAPSVTCKEMLATLAGRSLAATAGRRIVVAQDTTEINFAGLSANRRGLGAAGDGVSAGFFIHPLVVIDSETEAVLGLLDAHIWTRDEAAKMAPRRRRAFEDKESIRWLRGAERAAELTTQAACVVVVGDRESDIYGCFARRPAGVGLIVRAAQDRALADDASAVRQRGGVAQTDAHAGQGGSASPRRSRSDRNGGAARRPGHAQAPTPRVRQDRSRDGLNDARGSLRDRSPGQPGTAALAPIDHDRGWRRRGGVRNHPAVSPEMADRTTVPRPEKRWHAPRRDPDASG